MKPTNEKLLKFIDRRHPDYLSSLPQWIFMQATYDGGREWFDANIFRYFKEGDDEFNRRVARAYRFNHTREVVDLIGKYIFKSVILRNTADMPVEITTFWDECTLRGHGIDQFMQMLCNKTSIKGRMWVFVDTNKSSESLTIEDDQNSGARVYAYMVDPDDMLDVGYADDGELNWVKVREKTRDDDDPIESSGEVKERFRLWTRTTWQLYDVEVIKGRRKVTLAEEGENLIGRVPCFHVDHVIGNGLYTAPGLINDIAPLDRAVANYLSNLDAIIQDQTFSQLAIPAQNLLPEDEEMTKVLEMGTKRIFTYDGEGGAVPFFLSPDPKQAGVILSVIEKIINEIYHTIGAAGERTKQDNAAGIDNSSGVAKAYDFERLNSLLTMKSQSLENAEDELIDLVCLYTQTIEPECDCVTYPTTFDVRSLTDEFSIATQLSTISAPAELRREQMRQLTLKLFPQLSEELRAKIMADIDKWEPVSPADLAKAAADTSAAHNNLGNKSRQGQVTADTPPTPIK